MKHLFFLLLFLHSSIAMFAQIPQQIDVNTKGETSPLEEAPSYIVALIILLLISVSYYLIRRRRK